MTECILTTSFASTTQHTIYNIRRAQDIVNPRTDHCNIMLLAPLDGCNTNLRCPSHPFYYACVLSIYHANIVCTGQKVTTYHTCKMKFLIVRWYKLCSPLDRETDSGWYKLNMLHFVPMAEDDAFGFVNPANVLRSCHLVPAFHKGKLHPDGIGMSKFAQDAQDWKKYYINWLVPVIFNAKKPTNIFLTGL
ncbi:hypothetical protein SERLA73DRAFT_66097 [Serpula lacrymans var. lacrymans S7.3]|uniref:Uncharacterized protein n=1 Tax=Serpula lacrymans var. lacrymans (strain S7.3) TaxID=936435 RepID=F8QHK2_SERL3|nr:hypothetical protein SERLA73DRAFT_66097 [Serpula lacrymans var. lacrymans S7.3]